MPLYTQDPRKILFLDIETVSAVHKFDELSPEWQNLWNLKTAYRDEEVSASDFYEKRAAVMAEFGKVICISCGYIVQEEGRSILRVKSFSSDNEKEVLEAFAKLLNHHSLSSHLLCAHNGKEFDFPYMSRRMLVNGIKLPSQLNTSGAKPWEIPHIDTMEMWKFGDYKNYTGLKLLTQLFGIPSPKDDIDGSQVGNVYWLENDLERITKYCEKDVVALTQLFLKIEGHNTIEEKDILFST